MNEIILNLLNGISLGMVLFLLASGLSIVFGLMGILNLAHGSLYMIGAYVGWTIAVKQNGNYALALLAGALTAALLGFLLERVFFRKLHNQLNEQILLTFGLIYIFTNMCLWIWGPLFKPPFGAQMLSGSFQVAGITYPIGRFVLIASGLVLAFLFWWLQDHTQAGAIVRAGMDNAEMTRALGLNLSFVTTILFVFGSFTAGFAGVMGAQLLGVNLALGIDTLSLALIVIIVGGVGSVQGSLLGALLIGIIDAFGRSLFPNLAMFTMFLTMIIILTIKPSGLLGRK